MSKRNLRTRSAVDLKALIDLGENLEEATPQSIVYKDDFTFEDKRYFYSDGYESGFRPLEYAIQNNDVKAVCILLEYRPERRLDLTKTRNHCNFIADFVEHPPKGYDDVKWLGPGYRMYDQGYGMRDKLYTTETVLDLANRCHCDPEIKRLLLAAGALNFKEIGSIQGSRLLD